jgi:hypothetical protein
MFYTEILESFYKNKIRYLLVGGLALNLHGVPRTTFDMDIIIPSDKINSGKLINAIKELNYVPRLPVDPLKMADPEVLKDWIENKNMKAFSFYHKIDNARVIDIVLVHPLGFDEAEARKKVFTFRGIEIPVLSIDDLIEMKKFSGRPKDLSDAEMLREAKKISGDGNE